MSTSTPQQPLDLRRHRLTHRCQPMRYRRVFAGGATWQKHQHVTGRDDGLLPSALLAVTGRGRCFERHAGTPEVNVVAVSWRAGSNHRKRHLSEIFAAALHHQPDDHRHQQPKNRRTILHLHPVGAAAPGGAAVDQLVAQHVEAVQHDGEQGGGVVAHHRVQRTFLRGCEAGFPRVAGVVLAHGAPEGFEDELVVDQYADRAAELAEQGVVQLPVGVERDQVLDEPAHLLTFLLLEAEFAGIGGIEGDPQEDVAGVVVVRLLFSAGQPTDGAVDAHAQCFGLAVADAAVTLLEGCRVQSRGGLRHACFARRWYGRTVSVCVALLIDAAVSYPV